MRGQELALHRMHSERMRVSADVVAAVDACRRRGGRVVAVGTTVVRALESAASSGALEPLDGETDIFIQPGFGFRVVDALVTNFHLPESTLLMLVAAFAGRQRVLDAYADRRASADIDFSVMETQCSFRARRRCSLNCTPATAPRAPVV